MPSRDPLFIFRKFLTPWSMVLLEKLTGFQLVKKFPAFYGTRRLIDAFTGACHLSLYRARSIQYMPLVSSCLFNAMAAYLGAIAVKSL
jgi:hypothetical protein